LANSNLNEKYEPKDKLPLPPKSKFVAYRYVITLTGLGLPTNRLAIQPSELVRIAYLERRGEAGYFYFCVEQNSGRSGWFGENEIAYPEQDPDLPVRRQLPDISSTDPVNPRRVKYDLPEMF